MLTVASNPPDLDVSLGGLGSEVFDILAFETSSGTSPSGTIWGGASMFGAYNTVNLEDYPNGYVPGDYFHAGAAWARVPGVTNYSFQSAAHALSFWPDTTGAATSSRTYWYSVSEDAIVTITININWWRTAAVNFDSEWAGFATTVASVDSQAGGPGGAFYLFESAGSGADVQSHSFVLSDTLNANVPYYLTLNTAGSFQNYAGGELLNPARGESWVTVGIEVEPLMASRPGTIPEPGSLSLLVLGAMLKRRPRR